MADASKIKKFCARKSLDGPLSNLWVRLWIETSRRLLAKVVRERLLGRFREEGRKVEARHCLSSWRRSWQ